MRVIVIGPAADRARLADELARASFDVVAEFPTLAAARMSAVEADAIVVSTSRQRERRLAEPLTGREIQVLELLAEGLPNKAIALRLGISDQTIKFHVASISGKLGARNRTDAVRRAVRLGLIAF
jgi:two-component system nitrate/nitrite response regulator NarL